MYDTTAKSISKYKAFFSGDLSMVYYKNFKKTLQYPPGHGEGSSDNPAVNFLMETRKLFYGSFQLKIFAESVWPRHVKIIFWNIIFFAQSGN